MIAVVILAGGEGSRIGGDKPARTLGGNTLLDRAVEFARGLSDKIAIAVRDQQIGDVGVDVVQDEPEVEGPLGGLIAALRFASDKSAHAVLTLPTDMPFLPPDLADRLEHDLADRSAAIALSGEHLHPVCGLWHSDVLDAVPDYLASGRRSLKGLAEAVGYVAVEWPDDPSDPFFNINTPADLAEAERRLKA